MHNRTRRRSAAALGLALLAAAASLVVASVTGLTPDDNAGAIEGDVLIGNEGNENPVFDTVQDWRDLVKTVENESAEWYKQCLGTRIGVTWEQARRYAGLEDQGHDLRFIVISNTNVSDEEARVELANRGLKQVDNLPVVRVNGFSNTAGLPSDRCKPFGDDRSQVRVSLGIPVDANDLSKGLLTNKGVLAMCSNPWLLPPPGKKLPPPIKPPTTTTRPGETTSSTTTPERETTTTTVCTSKFCTGQTVTTQAAPPTTAPPRTTTTQPNNGGQGDSGDGATNTTSPPTTQSPAVTSPPTTTPPGPPPTQPPG